MLHCITDTTLSEMWKIVALKCGDNVVLRHVASRAVRTQWVSGVRPASGPRLISTEPVIV